MNWTEDEENTLISLMNTNIPRREISERLGRTDWSVKGKMAHLRHTLRNNERNPLQQRKPLSQRKDSPWSEEKTSKLRELVTTADLSFAEIGRIIGIRRNACIGKARRLGLVKSAKRVKKTEEEKRARSRAYMRVYNRLHRRKSNSNRLYVHKGAPKNVMIRKRIGAGVPALSPAEHDAVHLANIKNGQCKFIEGTDRMCCARDAILGTSWCPHHYARTHVLDKRTTAMASLNQQPVASC